MRNPKRRLLRSWKLVLGNSLLKFLRTAVWCGVEQKLLFKGNISMAPKDGTRVWRTSGRVFFLGNKEPTVWIFPFFLEFRMWGLVGLSTGRGLWNTKCVHLWFNLRTTPNSLARKYGTTFYTSSERFSIANSASWPVATGMAKPCPPKKSISDYFSIKRKITHTDMERLENSSCTQPQFVTPSRPKKPEAASGLHRTQDSRQLVHSCTDCPDGGHVYYRFAESLSMARNKEW